MKREWTTYFARLLGWTAAGSNAVAAAWTPALAALPDVAGAKDGDRSTPSPLIFERQNFNEGERYAGHSSHASHASHSSHYSGSGGDGGDDTSDTTPETSAAQPPSPPPPSPAVTAPTVPRATDNLVMVMRVQSKLHDRGYYTGQIDGTLGSTTRDAIQRYQLVEGLPATGKMDDATLAALGITY